MDSGDQFAARRDHAKQLGAEGRYSEAIVEWDRLIEFHTSRDEIGVADALAWKCWCLDRLGDDQRFLSAVDELIGYSDATDPWLRGTAGYGRVSKASWHLRHGRTPEAIAVTGDLVSRFEAEADASTRARLGERLLGVAREISWGQRSRGELLIDATLVGQPVAERVAPVWRAVLNRLPAPEVAKDSRPATLVRCWAETRSGRRTRLAYAVTVYDVLVAAVDGTADPALGKLGTRAQINRAVALVILGRWRSAKADFDALFALSPEELAEVVKIARATPGGEYDSTDVAVAIVANVAPDNDQHDRAIAKKLLGEESKHARSLVRRLTARTALLTGKRN